MELNEAFNFDLPKNKSSIIKVIGVGGGGGNAVNYMYSLGIKGIDYAVCNTDQQHLENSPIPIKLQLGANITEGLGAGANPQVGKAAAEESRAEIEKLLSQDTKMVFITAGMGGGTGTGAAPVIAEVSKSLGILTVGIVTTPFQFEGRVRLQQAEAGIEEMKKYVDSLIIINNNKLREIYGNLSWKEGFAKADEVVATAARSIAEVITRNFNINIDLRDVRTVLSDSGTAIMGSGRASGTDRAAKAVRAALDSPLLNDNHIKGATNVLLLINGSSDVTIDEIADINDYIQQQAGGSANIIMGLGEDESLGQDISVTVIATGFSRDTYTSIVPKEEKKTIFVLNDDENEKPKNLTEVNKKPGGINQKSSSSKEDVQPTLLDFEEKIPAEDQKNSPTANQPQQPSPTNQIVLNTESDEEVIFELKEDAEQVDLLYTTEQGTDTQIVEFDFEVPISKVMAVEGKKEVHAPDSDATERPGIQRYTLEDAEEVSSQNSSYVSSKEDTEIHFGIELKKVDKKSEPLQNASDTTKASVFEMSIEEGFKRMNKIKSEAVRAYNFRFGTQKQKLRELEVEPAYKRRGISIDEELYSRKSDESRFSVSGTGNSTELKTNNSFLHDNVD
ncbi:cell division protein FtsZ [Schleiferia thermophila]|jgi:cell division protein FtsZ|uniref:Cell division protein FtsZ n=1 Tax=Schleiferia thermophila TaxID=884107 RepID=A0A369ABF4_9FLAO|nr:cell division protein FtsZ [Schleiferia thermophila]KFD38783.1 cell division protein FtsZ [Schleiferia thermophila str. Yellowstone]RCX04754.1 cell division protein FtsZ [Schleiferia thermophila]GCD79717.1 cell division protein FtsZ [Schleiferia thermophila]